MEDFHDFKNYEKHEKFFRVMLSKKIAEVELENIRLRYIPDYIRELRTNKVYWGKEYRKWHDAISLKNWRSSAKHLQDEIIKQKTMLRNLDRMRILFVCSDDLNYFSKSLDPEHVEALVARIKENESNDNVILDMLHGYSENGTKLDFTDTFYIIYASCARYGEFRIRPNGVVKVK